jgi:hypothetical protein
MSEEVELSVGDRVCHADVKDVAGTIVRFQAYPMVTVQWDSTGRESSENMHLLVPAVEYREGPHGSVRLFVAGEEYGFFGVELSARAAGEWWARHFAAGGHPLTEEERQSSRRDTYVMEHHITYREHLGGPGYTPDTWEIFQDGARVGLYQTLEGAQHRIERLKEQGNRSD